ncbi:MAG: hypothetical protein E7051_05000 [Lentisphaerae bacterium]|nr:hypothetical protein [Lentisphaerota bacterium]
MNNGIMKFTMDAAIEGAANSVRLHYLRGGNWAVVSTWSSASGLSVTADQLLDADNGGVITDITVDGGGITRVFTGATGKNITLNNGQVIANGGEIDTAALNNGYMTVNANGIIRNVTVTGGALIATSYGSACSNTVKAGWVEATSGGVLSKTDVSGGALSIREGGSSVDTNVSSGAVIYIEKEGNASNTVLYQGAKTAIYSGGYCKNMTAYTGAEVYVSNGARVEGLNFEGEHIRFQVGITSDTNVQYTSGGKSHQISSGVVSGASIDANTFFEVSSGGVVRNLHITGCVEPYMHGSAGAMQLYSGGKAFGVENHASGQVNVFSGGYLYGAFADNEAEIYLYGGSADNLTMGSSGYVWIYSGGVANGVNVNGNGGFTISSGGRAANVVISGGHTIVEQSNAHISNVIIRNSGVLEVCGANASGVVISSGGTMTFSEQFLPMDGNSYISSPNGKAYDVTVSSGGVLAVRQTGSASGVTLLKDGNLQVWSGTEICSLVAKGGYAGIFEGASACDTDVRSGATLEIYKGAKHSGYLYVDSGANVWNNGTLDFTLTGRSSQRDCLVTNFSNIKGRGSYTITVSSDQRSGTYKLAENAGSFSGTLTIGNGSVNYGSITVNGADLVRNGVTYSLDNNNGTLTLTVSGGAPAVQPVKCDLDSNGLADVVLVHTKQGYSGAWISTGTNSLIKWGNLGNVNSKVELIGTGNISGSPEDGQDIFMKIGSTVAAWVVEDGKVKGYKELYNLKSNMNMLGIADFDGDGVTDYLLRSTAGDLGYVTGDDNKWHYVKGLGKEWKIAAVGDLNGDGMDDIVLRHDAGFAGTYLTQENGKVKWASLDTLKSDMNIVGTGDFNGDGVDDILLQNSTNGWVGAWLVEDGRVDSFIGICNNKNSIEQISDFNGDGIDDIRIRTAKGDIGVLYVNGADDTEWQYLQSVGKEWDTSFALLS